MTLVSYLILAAAGLLVGFLVGFWLGARLTALISGRALELAQVELDRVVAVYEGEIARVRGALPPRPARIHELVHQAVAERKGTRQEQPPAC